MGLPSVVAVTGSSGSLGRVILERLVAAPEVERIVGLDVQPPANPTPKLDHRNIDVCDPTIVEHLKDVPALMHLAFIVERGSRDADRVQRVNVGGSMNVFEACAKAGVKQVVYASSVAAYGMHPENAGRYLDESAPIRGNQDFYYSRTKAEVERWLDRFETEHPEISIARLRPNIFLGPKMSPARLEMFKQPIAFYLIGRNVPIQLIHEEDVSSAFMLALEKQAKGAFNIGTDEPLALRDWGRVIGRIAVPLPPQMLGLAEIAYKRGLSEVDPVWLRSSSEHPILVSSEKLKRELGWRPQYPTTASVLRAIAGNGAAQASTATKRFFGTLANVSRVAGGIPLDARQKAEVRMQSGSVNFVFTGDHPSEWHLSFRGEKLAFGSGLDSNAKSTVTMEDRVFHEMLSGKLRYTTAAITGKVRIRGDGNLTLLLGVLIQEFRNAATARGVKGLPKRAFAEAVLRATQRG
jgi:UDP-glucose 4-epimerase